MPIISPTTTIEDIQSSSGLVISSDDLNVLTTHFKITDITNGRLYKNNGITEILDGSFITLSEGNAGLKFTPNQDFNGSEGFFVRESTNSDDSGLLISSVRSSITVTAVNDAPVAVADTLSTVEEDSGARTISVATLLANDTKGGGADEAGQALNIVSISNLVGGTISIAAGDIVFTPTANFAGTASFNYTVQDSGGGPNTSAVASASFTVTAVNDAPVGVADTLSAVTEDSGARTISVATLLANDTKGGGADEAGQALNISSVSNAVGGTVQLVGGDIVFTPTADFAGTASFDYTIMDTGGGSNTSAPVTNAFTITAVNDAPVAVADTLSAVTEDSGARTISVATLLANDTKGGGADEAGQALNIVSISNLVGGTISIAAGDIVFTPTANFAGTASFNYTVQDSGGGPNTSAVASASFTVTAVNDAPVAVVDTLSSVSEDSGAKVITAATLLANDAKGGGVDEAAQTLTIASVSNAVGGTVQLVGGNVIFTPTADFTGTASFDYTVMDSGGGTNTSTPVNNSFTVAAVNDAPVAVADTLSAVTEDSGARTISVATLLANDTKGGGADEAAQTLTIASVSNPVGGTVQLVGGNVVFTPTADFTGAASFGYTVQDNGGTANGGVDTSVVASTSFAVTAVNDAPVIISTFTASSPENVATTTIFYTATVADPDGATPTFAITGGADAAKFLINTTTGAVTFAASPDFEAPTDAGGDNVYNIEITANDGSAPSAAQAVAITVTDLVEGGGSAGGGGSSATIGGSSGADTVQGTSGNDVIVSTEGADTIFAGDGSDTVTAGDAGNVIVGGRDSTDGADQITSGSGSDVIYGNGGDDTIASSGGNDVIIGGFGNDVVTLGTGDDLVFGNENDDIVQTGGGANTVFGGFGNEVIDAGSGNDLLFGNEGSDTIRAGEGDNTIVGGQDSTDGPDFLAAGAGNDFILGNGGDDTLDGGNGLNSLIGGYGNDSIVGGSSDDIIFGNQGNDVINAGDGMNLIFGGFGNDVVVAGAGADTIFGNEGNDTLSGGAGSDRYVFAIGSGVDIIQGFNTAEGDRLDLQGQTFLLTQDSSGNALLTLSDGGTITLAGIAADQVRTEFFA